MYDPLLYVQFPYLWQTMVSLVQSSFSVQSVIIKINVLGYKDIFEADMMNLFLQSGVSASAACFLMFCRTVDLSSHRINMLACVITMQASLQCKVLVQIKF